ncbi:MAG: hypothetical protein AAGB11_18780 [Pseudomonadota bacterium]
MVRNLLIPHVLACALISAALVVMEIAGTNRTMPDLVLATSGFALAIGAFATSVVAVVLVVWRPQHRPQWTWLIGHGGMLFLLFTLSSTWIATHLV